MNIARSSGSPHGLDIIDARSAWKSYIESISKYARGSQAGIPNMDSIMRDVIEENLRQVNQKLKSLSPSGVVTKTRHSPKAKTPQLWKVFDTLLRTRAKTRNPGHKPMGLPAKATKAAYRRYDAEAMIDHDGKYDHTRNADVHHIWPEALGGPTEGWNLVPLPPFQHHNILHPILDQIVNKTKEGQRIQLI